MAQYREEDDASDNPALTKERLRASDEFIAVLHFLEAFKPCMPELEAELKTSSMRPVDADALAHAFATEDPRTRGFSPILARIHKALCIGIGGRPAFESVKGDEGSAAKWPKALANALKRMDFSLYSDRKDIEFVRRATNDSRSHFMRVADAAEIYSRTAANDRAHLLLALCNRRVEGADIKKHIDEAWAPPRKKNKNEQQQEVEGGDSEATAALKANLHNLRPEPFMVDSAKCGYFYWCFNAAIPMRWLCKQEHNGKWHLLASNSSELETFLNHLESSTQKGDTRRIAKHLHEVVWPNMQHEERKEALRVRRRERQAEQLGRVLAKGSSRKAATRARKALQDVGDNKGPSLPAWMRQGERSPRDEGGDEED